MLSRSVRTFIDPDEYVMGFGPGGADITIAQRGIFSGKITKLILRSLWLIRSSEDLARTMYVHAWDRHAVMSFLTQPASATFIRNGVELSTTHILLFRSDQSFFQTASGPYSAGRLSLPLDELSSLSAVILGRELSSPDDALTIKPLPGAMTRLRRLHATAARLAEDAPIVLAHPEAARGLQQALIEAMMRCLDEGETHGDKAAQRQHAAIMRKFHRVIEQHVGEPLYVPELAKAVGASLRTLNACSHEYLAMGPKHYLLLRRMHMARRALRESAPGKTTVTEIATRYGFWQFG